MRGVNIIISWQTSHRHWVLSPSYFSCNAPSSRLKISITSHIKLWFNPHKLIHWTWFFLLSSSSSILLMHVVVMVKCFQMYVIHVDYGPKPTYGWDMAKTKNCHHNLWMGHAWRPIHTKTRLMMSFYIFTNQWVGICFCIFERS